MIQPSLLMAVTAFWALLGIIILLFAVVKRKSLPGAVFIGFLIFGILVLCSGALIFVGLVGMMSGAA